MRMIKKDSQLDRNSKPSKAFTKQELDGRRSLKETIPMTTFTRDEAILILSYLEQFECVNSATGRGKESLAVKPRISAIAPRTLSLIGKANFYQVRYKLENLVDAKDI